MKDLAEVMKNVDTLSEEYLDIAKNAISAYTRDLDALIEEINQKDADQFNDQELDSYLLKLSTCIYRSGARIEHAGILDDISRMLRQEAYNKAYLDSQTQAAMNNAKLSVAQTQSIAEEHCKYNTMTQSIYSRVYKEIKLKLDLAMDLVNSLRKIISRRMQEADFSRSSRGEY